MPVANPRLRYDEIMPTTVGEGVDVPVWDTGGLVINPCARRWGWRGNGSFDNSTAWDDLIADTTRVPDGSIIDLPLGEYVIGAHKTVTRPLRWRTRAGARLLFDTSDATTALTITGAQSSEIVATLTGTVVGGNDILPVDDTSGFEEGQIVRIVDEGALWPYNERENIYCGELNVVKAVLSGGLQLVHGITGRPHVLSAERTYEAGTTITVLGTLRNVVWDGIDIILPTDALSVRRGLDMRWCSDSWVLNTFVDRGRSRGLMINECHRTHGRNLKIRDHNRSPSGTGYGVIFYGAHFCSLRGFEINHGKAGVDISGVIPSRHIEIGNGFVDQEAFSPSDGGITGRALGTHGTAEYVWFHDIVAGGGQVGLYLRGAHIRAERIDFYSLTGAPVRAQGGHGHTIRGCTNIPGLRDGTVLQGPTHFFDASSDTPYDAMAPLVIEDCDVFTQERIVTFSEAVAHSADAVFIVRNRARQVGTGVSSYYYARLASGVSIDRPHIYGNTFSSYQSRVAAPTPYFGGTVSSAKLSTDDGTAELMSRPSNGAGIDSFTAGPVTIPDATATSLFTFSVPNTASQGLGVGVTFDIHLQWHLRDAGGDRQTQSCRVVFTVARRSGANAFASSPELIGGVARGGTGTGLTLAAALVAGDFTFAIISGSTTDTQVCALQLTKAVGSATVSEVRVRGVVTQHNPRAQDLVTV